MESRPLTAGPEEAADARLREALVALPADGTEARLSALNQRVLAQWEGARGGARETARGDVAVGAGGGGRAWLARWGRGRRAPWAAAAGLTAGLVLALHALSPTPDPALEELLQPDVLSQMAAGEM